MTAAFDLVTDAHGLITTASPEAAAVLATEERSLVRTPLASFVAGRDRDRFRRFLTELGRPAAVPPTRSFLLESRKGAEVAASVAAKRVDGSIAWAIEAETDDVVAAPVTALAEPARNELFERLLTRLPQGIVVVDADLRIVYANPAGRRLLATDDSAVRPGVALPEPWPDFSLRELAQSLFGPQPAAGTQLVQAGARMLEIEGLSAWRGATATLLLEDVTQRERAHRAEREFIENAAHELRTPLAAIISVLEVLDEGAKELPDARDRFLGHLRAHGDRLTRLTNSLLVLARIQTGQQQPRLELVPMGPLLREVEAELAPPPAVEIVVDATDRLAVLADRDLLHQAVFNVAANAVKHTVTGQVVLTARDLGRTTELEVRDTGRGMTREESAHAFDRFFGSKSGARGFGLGLAIADEAIRALGGTIEIDSSPRRGTCVRIRLPSAKIVS